MCLYLFWRHLDLQDLHTSLQWSMSLFHVISELCFFFFPSTMRSHDSYYRGFERINYLVKFLVCTVKIVMIVIVFCLGWTVEWEWMEDFTLNHTEKAGRTEGKKNVCEWLSKAVEGREKEKVHWGAVEYDGERLSSGCSIVAIRYHDKCPSWRLLLCTNALFTSEISWVVYHASGRAWMWQGSLLMLEL